MATFGYMHFIQMGSRLLSSRAYVSLNYRYNAAGGYGAFQKEMWNAWSINMAGCYEGGWGSAALTGIGFPHSGACHKGHTVYMESYEL